MTEQRLLVRVSFRKQVSDGNYGTESAEVTLEDYLTIDRTPSEEEAVADDLLDDARKYVHDQLAKSPSGRVRQAVADRLTVAAADGADPF